MEKFRILENWFSLPWSKLTAFQYLKTHNEIGHDIYKRDFCASILARKISMDGGARGLQSMGCKDSDATEQLSAHTHTYRHVHTNYILPHNLPARDLNTMFYLMFSISELPSWIFVLFCFLFGSLLQNHRA